MLHEVKLSKRCPLKTTREGAGNEDREIRVVSVCGMAVDMLNPCMGKYGPASTD
jgi:hypothetical protein